MSKPAGEAEVTPLTGRKLSRAVIDRTDDKDVLVLSLESANKITTDERLRMMDILKEREFDSIRQLARVLDRDPSVVKKDLDLLFKYDVIEYIEERGRKKPRLKHDHVLVEPVY